VHAVADGSVIFFRKTQYENKEENLKKLKYKTVEQDKFGPVNKVQPITFVIDRVLLYAADTARSTGGVRCQVSNAEAP